MSFARDHIRLGDFEEVVEFESRLARTDFRSSGDIEVDLGDYYSEEWRHPTHRQLFGATWLDLPAAFVQACVPPRTEAEAEARAKELGFTLKLTDKALLRDWLMYVIMLEACARGHTSVPLSILLSRPISVWEQKMTDEVDRFMRGRRRR